MPHSKLQKSRCVCWLSRRRRWTPQISFDVVKLAIDKAADPYSDYFDRCRRKRNVIDYDDAFVATETEAREILSKAKEFADVVGQWIAKVSVEYAEWVEAAIRAVLTDFPLVLQPV